MFYIYICIIIHTYISVDIAVHKQSRLAGLCDFGVTNSEPA